MSSSLLTGRLAKEHQTIIHMLQIYCKAHHDGDKHQGLCQQCATLGEYAEQKLDRCPYGESKPDCARCPIHCYKPEEREQARQAMRFAGPKMIWCHPIEAAVHLYDKRRPIPERPPKGASQQARRKAAERTQRDSSSE